MSESQELLVVSSDSEPEQDVVESSVHPGSIIDIPNGSYPTARTIPTPTELSRTGRFIALDPTFHLGPTQPRRLNNPLQNSVSRCKTRESIF